VKVNNDMYIVMIIILMLLLVKFSPIKQPDLLIIITYFPYSFLLSTIINTL